MLTKKVRGNLQVKEVIADEKTVAELDKERLAMEEKVGCNCNCPTAKVDVK